MSDSPQARAIVIRLSHPKGDVVIAVSAFDQKLAEHVAGSIEGLFGQKRDDPIKDLFGNLFGRN